MSNNIRQAWDIQDFDDEEMVANANYSKVEAPTSNDNSAGTSDGAGSDSFVYDSTTGKLTVIRSDGTQFIVSAVPVRLGWGWWFVKGGLGLRKHAEALMASITTANDTMKASLAVRELRARKPVINTATKDQGEVITLDPDKREYLRLLSEVEQTKVSELKQLLRVDGKAQFIKP